MSDQDPPLAKLADFGCANRWRRGAPTKTKFGTFIGTPAFLSPQLVQAGIRPGTLYDGVKADIWALGIMLCQMFTGSKHVPYW